MLLYRIFLDTENGLYFNMDFNTLLYIFAGLLIPLWIYWTSDPSKKRVARLVDKVPGAIWLPVIGTAWEVAGVSREGIWKRIDEITLRRWPIFRVWNGPIPEVHIMEADHMEVIFRSSVNINKGYVYNFLHPWLGTGLLTSTGEKWFSHRKLITPTFHFKILEAFQEVFAEKSHILVEKLRKEVGNESGFDIYPYITHCALDIICETAMGTQVNAQDDFRSPYVAAIYDMSELTFRRLIKPWVHNDFVYSLTADGKRFRECLDILHSFTKKVINEKRHHLKQKSKKVEEPESDILGRKRRVAFLDLLLEAAEEGAKITDEEIREEVDTFMFEGHDTTSAGLGWVLFLLGNNPEIQDKVFEEQAAIFQGTDRLPNIQDLVEMKYLERVIKESLRIYPSVPVILRHLTEDVQVGEYTLPAKSNVVLHIYHAHRNPKYFPEPEKFDPDRFLPENVQGRHPYAYVPFSAGSRNCIGQKFALLEEKTVLSSILRKYRVRALDTPANIILMGELILRPARGIRLVIERR